MKTIPSTLIVIAALASLSLAGCADDNNATIDPKDANPVVEVTPSQQTETAEPAAEPTDADIVEAAPETEEAIDPQPESDEIIADSDDEESLEEDSEGDLRSPGNFRSPLNARFLKEKMTRNKEGLRKPFSTRGPSGPVNPRDPIDPIDPPKEKKFTTFDRDETRFGTQTRESL